MPDIVLTERQQDSLRTLMALEAAPGSLPPEAVLELVDRLVPSDSDYTSGHAAATGSWVEVVRRTMGDDTDLTLRTGMQARSYDTLAALEHDALHARIWGGLHFRDAMDDGYHLAHTTAERVMAAMH